MERLLGLTEFWNWLPAFRAVAESEHLPTAARHLRVSPSSLCRTIRLLETSVGMRLFNREGRNIRLNQAGEEFLGFVRDSMRLVDDGLSHVRNIETAGALHLTAAWPFSFTMFEVLRELKRNYPNLVPCLHDHLPSDMKKLLLRGELDVAFVSEPVLHDGLLVEPLSTVTSGVYCGRKHTLFGVPRLTSKRALRYDFVAPIPGDSGPTADGWPRELERRVAVQVPHLHLALSICAAGDVLAVVPDRVAAACPERGALRRLPVDLIPPIRLFAVRRRRLGRKDAVDLVIEAVQRHHCREGGDRQPTNRRKKE